MTLNAEGEISNAGMIRITHNVDISGATLSNQGDVSGSQVVINVDKFINQDAHIGADNNLVINSNSLIDNQGGTILSRGSMTLKSGLVNNEQGTISSNGNVSIEADSLKNKDGSITTYNTLDLSLADAKEPEGYIRASHVNRIYKGTEEATPEPEQQAPESGPDDTEGAVNNGSDYGTWAEQSGFMELFSQLYNQGGNQFKLRWNNTYLNDVMKFFYEVISSGQELTDEMIYQASSPGLFGSQGLENVGALTAAAELMKTTWQQSNNGLISL